jgi:hypothetical protein
MAGNYPDAPGARMSWDRDGSIAATISDAGTVSPISGAAMLSLNGEVNATNVVVHNSAGGGSRFGILFPELRDIIGYLVCWGGIGGEPQITTLETSVDTTNLFDGSWTTQANPYSVSSAGDKTAMRTSIDALALTGIKAIRWRVTSGGNAATDTASFFQVHLYGGPSAGQNPDRLRLWHPTLDQEIGGAHFDWGNVPRNSSADKLFRVKNNSSTLTANTITLSTDALTDTTPSVPGQHLLSLDGTTFAATRVITSLAPGAISGSVMLRRTTPSNASLSMWWARVRASAASWA